MSFDLKHLPRTFTDLVIANVGGVIYTFINSGLRVNIFGVRVSVFLVSF